MVHLRAHIAEAADGRGGPRPRRGQADLPRYAQWAHSTGAGPYAVALGLKRFWPDLKRYSLDIRKRRQDGPTRPMHARSNRRYRSVSRKLADGIRTRAGSSRRRRAWIPLSSPKPLAGSARAPLEPADRR